jgi:hypothetical protein
VQHTEGVIKSDRAGNSRETNVIRLISIVTLSASLAGCVTAGSSQTSARWTDSPPAGGHRNMPPSAPRNPNACIHDEGYGRWTDCGAEM